MLFNTYCFHFSKLHSDLYKNKYLYYINYVFDCSVRWEEEKHEDGVKWKSLEHKGPVFATDYEPLPGNVKFKYNGKEMKLAAAAEEVASFYGAMLDHDYVTKDVFNKNFFKDWRKFMTHSEKEIITDLKKCDFTQMLTYFKGNMLILLEGVFCFINFILTSS